MPHVLATPSLAARRPQEESPRSGSWQDVTRASLSDRFRARGSFLAMAQVGGSRFPRVSLPLRYPAEPLPFLLFTADCPKGVRRGYFAMRRRRTARAFRDTSVIIRRRCRNGVPARGRTRKRVDETGTDVSNTAESCGDPGEVGKAPRDKTRFLTMTLVIYLEWKVLNAFRT